MKYLNIFFTTFLVVFLVSCSSTKVTDAWKSEHFSDIKENNFLVIARTDNLGVRQAFESEIANVLKKNGVRAKTSFSVLPTNLSVEKELTENQKNNFREFLQNEAYDGIVLSVIKDVQEITKTVTDGGYYAGATIPRYYPGYYNGFFSYYYDPLSYSNFGVYVEPTSTTYTSTTFVVETVVYDLRKDEGNQLLAVVTSRVDNPSDIDKNAKEFTKKIVGALK